MSILVQFSVNDGATYSFLIIIIITVYAWKVELCWKTKRRAVPP